MPICVAGAGVLSRRLVVPLETDLGGRGVSSRRHVVGHES
uniref:Uncharacterized protein n=1 Tax=Arundo donax TaxID=35708 RepID=A0A0A9B737_ARUDO